jgi:hypothetical protein
MTSRLLVFAAAAPLLLGGCPFLFPNDPSGPPCEDDLLGCNDNTETFEIDPECTLEGDLELVLGEGVEEFEALEPDQVPMINYGTQGGQHIWAALQVRNPSLDHPMLKVGITVSTCSASDCSDPSSWTIDNTRELVAGQADVAVTDEGWFEVLRMLVTVQAYAFESRGRVEVLVTDQCGRQGYLVAEGTPVG